MDEYLDKDDLMDVIMSYDRYVQDICSTNMTPVTVAVFYDTLYPLYSERPCSQYAC